MLALTRGRLASSVAVLAATSYIGTVDPHRPGVVFPPCPFRLLTGWNCPGCGGLRMVHDVLHADMSAAITDNAYLLVGLPVLMAVIVVNRWRRKAISVLRLSAVVGCTALLWMVVRNLPDFPLTPGILTG